jgi:hypothetical protein
MGEKAVDTTQLARFGIKRTVVVPDIFDSNVAQG